MNRFLFNYTKNCKQNQNYSVSSKNNTIPPQHQPSINSEIPNLPNDRISEELIPIIKNSIQPPRAMPVEKQIENYSIPSCTLIKSAAFGGIILQNNAEKDTTYNVASINIDTTKYHDFYVMLNFNCNICIMDATLHLRFQIVKQGTQQPCSFPLNSGFIFFRGKRSTQSDTISIHAYDLDSICDKYCNYSVIMDVMSNSTSGTIAVLNPTLTATIL